MPTYTLFSQANPGAALVSDTGAYTFGVQFSVSVQGYGLAAIWWYSAAGAGGLPGTIALFTVAGSSLVHSEAASWSGAAGSGWVRAAFTSPPALTASTAYKGCTFFNNTGVNFYAATSHYWDSGAGSAGVTNGPLTAPNNAGSSPGQDAFLNSAVLGYPASTFNSTNYWVDAEVTAPGLAARASAVARRPRARARWQGRVLFPARAAGFTIGRLTSWSAAGNAVLGLFDETGVPVLDEAGGFITGEDGS